MGTVKLTLTDGSVITLNRIKIIHTQRFTSIGYTGIQVCQPAEYDSGMILVKDTEADFWA